MNQSKQNKERERNRRPASDWELLPPFGTRSIFVVTILFLIMIASGKNTEIDRMFYLLGEAASNLVGLRETSQVLDGASRVADSMFPLQFSESVETSRIEGFDPNQLPAFTEIRTENVIRTVIDPQTLKTIETETTRTILYHPFGYLFRVGVKMLETLEIAIWATLFSIILSIPLAYFSAINFTLNKISYVIARAMVSMFRAVPELISAMFLVLAFGFGPIAGIMALAIHSAGFLGKFYAEDIENADRGPQEALLAVGASKVKILRYAILPQVLPQYVAYNLYILDRNIRMATVVGIVGAGGVGQELKGRYDMFEYGHVATILLAVFLTVFILDQISGRIRSKLI